MVSPKLRVAWGLVLALIGRHYDGAGDKPPRYT